MDDTSAFDQQNRARLLVNLGSGPKDSAWLPAMFADWRELRVDADAKAVPDLLADITDLSAIETGSIDAIWSAHCLEHLYLHQVPGAIAEGNTLTVALPKRMGAGDLFEPPAYWMPAGGAALVGLENDIRAVLRMADTVIKLDFFAAGRQRDAERAATST